MFPVWWVKSYAVNILLVGIAERRVPLILRIELHGEIAIPDILKIKNHIFNLCIYVPPHRVCICGKVTLDKAHF
jgi:hypothetical protein